MQDDTTTLSTDSFAEMLNGPDENEQTEQSDSQSDETAQESSEETAQEGEAEQVEADEVQAEQPETDSANEVFLELEINGEKVQVSKDEAKNGYLRQQDYTQKAQNLARERQESQAHIAQQFAQVTQMSQEIGQLTNIDAALRDYGNVDWQTLRNDDPTAFAVHQAEFNNLRIQRGDVVAAIGQKQAAFSATQAQQFAQQTAEAERHLQSLPGFTKEHLATMKESGIKAGFTPQELATVSDKRQMEVLWKAAQYDRMQADKSRAVKTVAALPTKASKAAPVAKSVAQVQTEKLARRVAQTGNVRDFAALLGAAS